MLLQAIKGIVSRVSGAVVAPVIEASQVSMGTAQALTVVAPAGITSGELLLCIGFHNYNIWNSAVSTPPAGWTEILDQAVGGSVDTGVFAFWKIADGTEGNISTNLIQSRPQVVWYMRISGAHPTSPIDGAAYGYDDVNGTTPIAAPLSTTVDKCLCLVGIANNEGWDYYTAASGNDWSLYDAQGDGNFTGVAAAIADKTQDSAGSPGSVTFTNDAALHHVFGRINIAPDPSGGGGSTLLNGLLHWWTLDETSGSRADSHGTLNLTTIASGVAYSASGKKNGSVDLAGGTSVNYYLYTPQTTSVPAGENDWATAFWVYPYSTSTEDKLCVGFGAFQNNLYSFQNWWVGVNGTTARIRYVTTNPSSHNVDLASSVTANAWNLIYAQYNAATEKFGISVNNGTLQETDRSVGLTLANNANSRVQLGDFPNASYELDGLLDEVAIWDRRLTESERTELYNAGSGVTYSDL